MKKITFAVLVFVLAVSLMACGCQNRGNTVNTPATTQTTTTPTTGTIIDPTIMDPTIETNIPDPDINTMPDMGTEETGNGMDNTIIDGMK